MITPRNGSEVIAQARIEENMNVVLCKFNGGYAVWSMDDEGYTFWGHYLDNLKMGYERFLNLTKKRVDNFIQDIEEEQYDTGD